MKKHNMGRGVAVFIVAALILGSSAMLGFTMNAAQATADKEVVSNNVNNWDGVDYSLPESAVASDDYEGTSTMELMPIDLSLTKADVPLMMEKLNSSEYLAVYVDDEIYLRVTKEVIIQISNDNGTTWMDYESDAVAPEDFALWLHQNDPLPGYSMREMQERLENGAEVKHIVLKDGKEMYFVIDETGVQIELVQLEKVTSILIDGQRMMITSTQIPYLISQDMLNSFYDLLVSSDILTETEAEQNCSEMLTWLENQDSFEVTP